MEKHIKMSTALVLFSLILMAHPLAYEYRWYHGGFTYTPYYFAAFEYVAPGATVVLTLASLLLLLHKGSFDLRNKVRICMFFSIFLYIATCIFHESIGHIGGLIAIVHGLVIKLSFEKERVEKVDFNDLKRLRPVSKVETLKFAVKKAFFMEKFSKKSICLVLISLALMADPYAFEYGGFYYGSYYELFWVCVPLGIIVLLSIASLIFLVLNIRFDTSKMVRLCMTAAVCFSIFSCLYWKTLCFLSTLIAILHVLVVRLTLGNEQQK